MLARNSCLFIATTAYASAILHRNKKDLRGKKYNAELGLSEPAPKTSPANVVDIAPQQPVAPVEPPPKGYYYAGGILGEVNQNILSPVYSNQMGHQSTGGRHESTSGGYSRWESGTSGRGELLSSSYQR